MPRSTTRSTPANTPQASALGCARSSPKATFRATPISHASADGASRRYLSLMTLLWFGVRAILAAERVLAMESFLYECNSVPRPFTGPIRDPRTEATIWPGPPAARFSRLLYVGWFVIMYPYLNRSPTSMYAIIETGGKQLW